MSADLVLINGNVLTMNPAQPLAEAVAVKGEKIVKVGTNEEINPLIGKTTKIIKLNGKTVVPGFIDTHIHVTDFGRLLLWKARVSKRVTSTVSCVFPPPCTKEIDSKKELYEAITITVFGAGRTTQD